MSILLYKLISNQYKYYVSWKLDEYYLKLKVYINKKKMQLPKEGLVFKKKKCIKKREIIFFLKASVYITNFLSKKNTQKYAFYIKILISRIKINFFTLSICMFGVKIMLNSISVNDRLCIVEIVNTIQKKINLSESLFLSLNKKNNQILIKLVLRILFLAKKNHLLHKNDFLIKCFLLYKKNKFLVYKFIQEIKSSSNVISSSEIEKLLLIYKQHLNYKQHFIRNIKKKNVISFYPIFFLIIFENFRKSGIFLVKITKKVSKNCLYKIPLFLLFEIIEILLKFIKTKLTGLSYVKIFYFFFKLKNLSKKYKKNRNFLFFIVCFKLICIVKYCKKIGFFLNKLIRLCKKKNVCKKILLCIFQNFFQKENYFNNNFIRLFKILIYSSKISKDKLFVFSFKIFFLLGKQISNNFSNKKINVTLRTLHTILELFIKKFYLIINKFIFFKLSKKLQEEMSYNQKIFQNQAAVTIKVVLKKNKIKKITNIILKNLVKIFYKKAVILEFIYIFTSKIPTNRNQVTGFFIKKLLFEIKSKKIILIRALLKLVFCFLNRNFPLVIKKCQWVYVCVELIKVSVSFDFLVKKYCLCCIFLIKNVINYEKIIEEMIFFYKNVKKKRSLSKFVLLSLFTENPGCQAVLFFAFHIVKTDSLTKRLIGLDIFMYMVWYLPEKIIDYYSDLICFILEKLCIQKRRCCNFYIVLGLFSKKIRNTKYIPSLYFILANIWPDIYQIKKLIFKCVLFSIQKICFFVNNIQIKFMISIGIFHSIKNIRKIYWHIYHTTKNKLRNTYIDLILPNVSKKFKII
nr:mRNA splicing factor U2 snRNP subunit [Cryptomonas paramecium]